MANPLRIGTRESELALWQAGLVKMRLAQQGIASELVPIKSEGDLDLTTPLYAMGVQGIFTRSLDIALLSNQIDLAVHSMKDVPVQLPKGIRQVAVMERDNPFDLFVPASSDQSIQIEHHQHVIIASSSLRRKAQWLHRFPDDAIEPIRGNVNTRMKKLKASNWWGAIFAAAGLERIGIRPANALELDWMIPAPAQGAILIAGRENDQRMQGCEPLNHEPTAFCVKTERDFLSALMGGCSTPIGALAVIEGDDVFFRGNLLDEFGKNLYSVEKKISLELAASLGASAAREILQKSGMEIKADRPHA